MFKEGLLQRVVDAEKFLDRPDVLELAKKNPDIRFALSLRRYRNWWGAGVSGDDLLRIVRDDAIPLAWVPRVSVVTALAAAKGPASRQQVLIENDSIILEDCRVLLEECTHFDIQDRRDLIAIAVEAYTAGHREAAMTLAVAVGEGLALWASEPRVTAYKSEADRDTWEKLKKEAKKYGQAKLGLEKGDGYMFLNVMEKVLIAPIPHFFTPWTPKSGKPTPERLSRHVVAHQPTLKHFSRFNCLTSLMLVVSILKQQHEWAVEVSFDDE
ncbi:hypothetical protein [Amycolatopsis sp. cmx-4-68]|uniref:hypothetical protein n=1 Tax=Amycolatopsis sp. cmx-4-68 TaxID=2790938 RepID=UPI00397D5777